MSSTHVIYTPRPDATPEAELNALAAVYRFLLLERGGRHDLTNGRTTEAVENGPRTKEKKEKI